jgi:hypothetical protein
MKTNKILIGLIAACALHAAGTVQQSLSQLGSTNNWVVAFNWTGDASTGSVPNTAAQGLSCCQGYIITQVETVPGSTAPTSGYSVAINDPSGVDVLQGAAASLSATNAQTFAASSAAPPLQGTFTLVITGQSVASATGRVYVFLTKPGTVGNLATLIRGQPAATPGGAVTYAALAANGTTNDRPALQSLINTLSAGNGGTIILPTGYILLSGLGTELLNFPGPATVSMVGQAYSGSGSGTTLWIDPSVGASTDVIHINPSAGVIIGMQLSNFAITAKSGTPARHGINVDTTTRAIYQLLIDSLYINPLGGKAIISTNPSLSDGFFLSIIQNSLLSNGMQFNRLGDTIRILNNAMIGSGIGVEVVNFVPGAADLHIEGNSIVNTGAWVKLGDAFYHPIITGNTFEGVNGMTGSNSAGLDLDGGGSGGLRALVANNRISTLLNTAPNLDGVRINLCTQCYVHDNVFQQPASHGSTVAIRNTASAVKSNIGYNQFADADVYPNSWADAGSGTYLFPRCEQRTINSAQVTSATNTQSISLYVHPTGGTVTGARVLVNTPWTATNLLTLTVSIGDTCCGNTFYENAVDIKSAAIASGVYPANNSGAGSSPGGNVIATFTGTYSSGNFSTNPLTGTAEIDVCWGLFPFIQ